MADGHCICGLVPDLPPLRTRIEVLMHRREWSKTTATAHLARLTLGHAGCRIHLRGHENRPLDPTGILSADRLPLLLFPTDDAVTLSAELVPAGQPVALLVPDGSWRQAAKVPKRERWLEGVRRVMLPAHLTTRYQLRREPREGGMATFEAIAHALGILEGEAVAQGLLAVFDAMVRGTLETRGRRGLPGS